MSYLYKQKLLLQDLIDLQAEKQRVLVFEPEEYLSALYFNYLNAHNFEVECCMDLSRLVESLLKFEAHLLVFNVESQAGIGGSRMWLKVAKTKLPELLVVTTGYNLTNEGVKELMSTGISSHINRRLSRPQDVATIAKTLLVRVKN